MDNIRFKILPFIEITDKRQKRRFASKWHVEEVPVFWEKDRYVASCKMHIRTEWNRRGINLDQLVTG